MSDDIERQHEISARDRELAQRLAHTLDRSVDTLDADTRARLAALRHAALSRSRTQRAIAVFAIAASLVAVISLPWFAHRHAMTTTAASEDMAYLNVDPQMLEDMDMLQAIGERE